MTIRRLLARLVMPGLLLSMLLPAHAEEVVIPAETKRLLNGNEIFMHFKFDQWRIRGESSQGFRFDVRVQPNGEIYGTNLSGGGSLSGQWEVNPREDILCLRWERSSGLPRGCYLVIQTGLVTYRLNDPGTGETVWQFVLVSGQ